MNKKDVSFLIPVFGIIILMLLGALLITLLDKDTKNRNNDYEPGETIVINGDKYLNMNLSK